ncbi:MAG TPA: three-Cys-motif partner protein TcmP [Longimicrobium sp.]|nr:three-Cys-motif partner protein TcmP [Longimicrobium sp.]
MALYDKLPVADPDEYTYSVTGEWSRQKHLPLWNYLRIVSTGMKDQFASRVYIDLYAGAGKARIKGTDELLLGSPLLALAVRDAFDRHVFCEADPELFAALSARVSAHANGARAVLISGDAEKSVEQILTVVPRLKTLSLCFVDPYDLGFSFEMIRRLSHDRRMDFLVLVAAQMDGQRNERVYARPESRKIERLLNDPDWRTKWAQVSSHKKFATFLVERFTAAMLEIGYQTPPPDAEPIGGTV